MDDVFHPALQAIYLANHGELRELISADPALVTSTSSCGHRSLLQFVACEADKFEQAPAVARILVEHGAPMSGPLVSAAGCGSSGVLAELLELGADINGDAEWTPLDEALYWCNNDIAHDLVKRGATIARLRTAAGLGRTDLIASFFDDAEPNDMAGPIASPFADTVPAERADDPQAIVDHAFVMAVNCGQQATAAELLALGAGVNATPPGYHWRGTALHAACWRGHAELVTWLIEHDADPSIHDGLADADAAGWANHHGHPQLIGLLTKST